MAHFAKLDENNVVDSVVVISNIHVIDKSNNNEEIIFLSLTEVSVHVSN